MIGITGSIGALGSYHYLVVFGQIFKEIKVIMTPAACQFVEPASLKYICPNVYVDNDRGDCVSHVELASWADHFLVLPATANTLAHAAYGFAHNMLTQTLLCYDKGAIFFPNMNRKMWLNSSVQRNVEKLRSDGHIVFQPIEREAFEQATRSIEMQFTMPTVMETLEFLCQHTTLEVGHEKA